jgi:hypothetical protein
MLLDCTWHNDFDTGWLRIHHHETGFTTGWPVNRGCSLLLGTWSHLRNVRGSVLAHFISLTSNSYWSLETDHSLISYTFNSINEFYFFLTGVIGLKSGRLMCMVFDIRCLLLYVYSITSAHYNYFPYLWVKCVKNEDFAICDALPLNQQKIVCFQRWYKARHLSFESNQRYIGSITNDTNDTTVQMIKFWQKTLKSYIRMLLFFLYEQWLWYYFLLKLTLNLNIN